MANWSVEDWYVGCIVPGVKPGWHTYDTNKVFEELSWADAPGYFRIASIVGCGPCVHIHGEGKWGATPHFSEEFRAWTATKDVVVLCNSWYEWETTRTIRVAGELVFEDKFYIDPDTDLDEYLNHERWWFKGRSQEEKHFFSALFVHLNREIFERLDSSDPLAFRQAVKRFTDKEGFDPTEGKLPKLSVGTAIARSRVRCNEGLDLSDPAQEALQ